MPTPRRIGCCITAHGFGHATRAAAFRAAHPGVFASAEEARAFIEQDPFFKIGLFGDIKIIRWRKAYVDGVCKL